MDRILLFSSSSPGRGVLPDLTRLLEREAAAAVALSVVGGSGERIPAMVAALHRLCCVMGLLRSLLPLLTLTQQQQQQQQGNQDDECLSRSVAALGQWLGRLGADLGAALAAEAEPLLRALLDDSARLLDGGLGALWPLSSVALTSLLAAAAPLGLGPGPSGQGSSSPLMTAAEVDALRAEMDSLRAEIQVLRSQSSSQVGTGGTSIDLSQRLQQAEVRRRNRSPLYL